MLGKKEYIGLDLRENAINVAQIKVEGKKIKLVKLDRYSLVEKIKRSSADAEDRLSGGESIDEEQEAESIFGLEEEEEMDFEEESGEIDEDDIDFDDLEDEKEEEDLMSLDMVDETETAQSNEVLLYNILTDIDPGHVNAGLNVGAGNTIFQIIRDTDFNEVKKKDLIEDLEQKLESIYGVSKSSDYYNYEVREDGSLILASIEDEPAMLRLVNRARDLYTGKITIEEVLSDEISLVGMIKANYDLQPEEITGVLQIGESQSRISFLKGNEIWKVSPLINEGTQNKSFLNTVFSKILFQLDTGEVPNLDRIILANNTIGEEAVNFFQQNFSDIEVSNFRYDEEKFDYGNIDPDVAKNFTTAIATAWAASGADREAFPDLSLLPDYVVERQKIFKLQWHGILLLVLIFLSPVTVNYFYQQNAAQIESLNNDVNRLQSQITQINPTVESTNQVMNELDQLREKLVLLDTLSKGSREWSTKLDILNNGIDRIGSTWLTSMSQSNDGTFIQGYTLFRSRIPRIVELFDEATLLNVTIREIREQEVFEFSISIKEFAEDPAAYSPPKPEDLQQILNN